MPLPPLLPVSEIHARLQNIYPEGTANRNYQTREIAAKTVFVMLYIGAVEGAGCWLRPNQVVARDDELAQAIGLRIEPDRNLPDAILVDLGPAEPLLVFVEIVASAGPVSDARLAALLAIATEAGFRDNQVAFVTAYADRSDAAFKRTASELAWRSFAWFMSEPENVIALHGGIDAKQVQLSNPAH